MRQAVRIELAAVSHCPPFPWQHPGPLPALPVLGVGVLEQLGQLQGVFADFLHGGEQEAIQGDVNHLLQQAAGLEEVHVLVDLGEARQLQAGVGVVVAVLGVDLKLCLLQGTGRELLPCPSGRALPQTVW